MLAAIRAEAEVVFSDEALDAVWHEVSANVAWMDQYRAAAAEAKAALPALADGVKGARLATNVVTPPQFSALLTAAAARCLCGHACPHTDGGRPVLAFLGARVVACRGCMIEFESLVDAQDARVRAGEDNICDFCLEDVPDRQFRPLRVQSGPFLLYGDSCESCFLLAGVTP